MGSTGSTGGRGLEDRIIRLMRRAAAYRGRGNEEAAQEVEDEIRLLELLPQDSPLVADLAEAALELEENLNEHEARRKR
jgi:hypothetical protein